MIRHLVFRPQAESEIRDAHHWYEQRRHGLGPAFVAAVDLALTGVMARPLAYPLVHGQTRRALVDRFPYGIYFRVLAEEVVVLAIVHGRRHPRRWRSRR